MIKELICANDTYELRIFYPKKHGEKGLELYKIDKNVGKILELLCIEK